MDMSGFLINFPLGPFVTLMIYIYNGNAPVQVYNVIYFFLWRRGIMFFGGEVAMVKCTLKILL